MTYSRLYKQFYAQKAIFDTYSFCRGSRKSDQAEQKITGILQTWFYIIQVEPKNHMSIVLLA